MTRQGIMNGFQRYRLTIIYSACMSTLAFVVAITR